MSLRETIPQDRRSRSVGAALTLLAGLLLLVSSERLTDQLSNWSYEWLLHFRPDVNVDGADVVVVSVDDESQTKLDQPRAFKDWDRALHARLLQTLTEKHADVIVFDAFFQRPDTNHPAADAQLVAAARKHGRTLFGAIVVENKTPAGEINGRSPQPPGLPGLDPDKCGLVEGAAGPDGVFREHQIEIVGVSSLAWKAAQFTMAHPPSDPERRRWINYYAPASPFHGVSYWRVLSNMVPPSINFSNKTVFIGAHFPGGLIDATDIDNHPTPCGRLYPGVDIVATVYLNLVRDDWLRPVPALAQFCLIVVWGLTWGYALPRFRPVVAVTLGVASVIGVVAFAVVLFVVAHAWIIWLIPAAVQTPCALGWAILANTRRLAKEKADLEARLQTEVIFAETRRDTGVPTSHVLPPTESPTALAGTGETRRIPGISDHTLLRCVGRGAYGEVWLARDVIGSFHAVKIVYRSSFNDDGPFEREFRGLQKYTPISRTHAGWVHVLHIGRNDTEGHFFCVMEAGDDEVSGPQIEPNSYQPRNLARELKKRGPLPLEECVTLGLALAEALEHLHRHQLIHRDIKPSNVIFVRGAPKFADIGLVTEMKRGGDDDVSYLGTEGYIAPEGPGTAAADVYSLGKLLYEISMGRDRREFPELPTALMDASPSSPLRQFSEIIVRACATEPDRRYPSAAALQSDLAELQRQLAKAPGQTRR